MAAYKILLTRKSRNTDFSESVYLNHKVRVDCFSFKKEDWIYNTYEKALKVQKEMTEKFGSSNKYTENIYTIVEA